MSRGCLFWIVTVLIAIGIIVGVGIYTGRLDLEKLPGLPNIEIPRSITIRGPKVNLEGGIKIRAFEPMERAIRRIQQGVPLLKLTKCAPFFGCWNLAQWLVTLVILAMILPLLTFIAKRLRTGGTDLIKGATGRDHISLPKRPKDFNQAALWVGILTILSGMLNLGVDELVTTFGTNKLVSLVKFLASLGPMEAGLLTLFALIYSFAFILPAIWEALQGANFLGKPTLGEAVSSAIKAVSYLVTMLAVLTGGGAASAAKFAPQLLIQLEPKGRSLGIALQQPTAVDKLTTGLSAVWDLFLSVFQLATANYNSNMLLIIGGSLLVLSYMFFRGFRPFAISAGGRRSPWPERLMPELPYPYPALPVGMPRVPRSLTYDFGDEEDEE